MAEATETLTLKIYGRDQTGKNASYRFRQNKLIPAVVYGPNLKSALTVNLSPKDIREIYLKSGKTSLVTLEALEGAPTELTGTKVLFKEIQTHPYKNQLTHVDLHQLDLKRKIRVTVPLAFTGKSKGLAEGGIMSIISRAVEIKCLPTEIPNHIDVDVTDLGVNDSIHIDDLSKKNTAKFEYIFDTNFVLVAVVPPEAEEVVTPVVDATAAAAAGATPAAGAAGAAAPGAAAAAAPAAAGAAAGGDKAKAKK